MSEPHLVAPAHFFVGCASIIAGLVVFAAPKGRRVHLAAGLIFLGCSKRTRSRTFNGWAAAGSGLVGSTI